MGPWTLWALSEPELGQRSIYNFAPSDLTLTEGHDDTLGLQLSMSPQTLCLTVIECLDISPFAKENNLTLL